jgi:signal transduction histidine kinase
MQRVLRFLVSKADPERRAALTVLVTMRWLLIAGAIFQVNYRPGSEPRGFVLLNTLILIAALVNGVLQWRLLRPRAIPLWFPMAVGFYDVVGVTGAISSVEGFDNPSYLLYYPALLSFVLVFPGKWSIVYTLAVMGAYSASSIFGHDSFAGSSAGDQKALVLRLLTLATAGLMANLVVRVERARRVAAVEAEARAAGERLAAEQRALAAEREVEEERGRLSREIHDGVSQRVYMLSLGLENAAVAARRTGAEDLAGRLDTLHQVSRETLLETRNLLFDLGRVMAGETGLGELARNLASEFTAVTGIPVEVTAEQEAVTLDAAQVGEVFRILQESLANVMKHSGATAARVALRDGGGVLNITVEDNGRGFDPEGARMGHGLNNIRERAARLGGEAAITSSDGAGTKVALSIPVAVVAQ